MSFLWLLILYDFKSNEMSCQKFRILIKEVCLLMCIFPGMWCNTDFKSVLFFMTQKSPDFSHKVWLLSSLVERKWWLQMVVVFPVWSQTMSRPFHSREWFWGGPEWGRLSSLGERIEGRVCSFGGGTEGRKTFLLMWLSCPRLPYFSRTTLICLSLIVSVFPVSMSYRSLTFIGVFCSTVGITHTSQSGQSPTTWGLRSTYLSCLCLILWLTAFTLKQFSALPSQCLLCDCGCPKPRSPR